MVKLFRAGALKQTLVLNLLIVLLSGLWFPRYAFGESPPQKIQQAPKQKNPGVKQNTGVTSMPLKNMLVIQDVTMEDVSAGRSFSLKFTVLEPGTCKIKVARPEVLLKAETGETRVLPDRNFMNNTTGNCLLSCNELEGSKGNCEYLSLLSQGIIEDSDMKWKEIGICLTFSFYDDQNVRNEKTECTWFTLVSRPYYNLKQ